MLVHLNCNDPGVFRNLVCSNYSEPETPIVPTPITGYEKPLPLSFMTPSVHLYMCIRRNMV